jgi:hypothetical protein
MMDSGFFILLQTIVDLLKFPMFVSPLCLSLTHDLEGLKLALYFSPSPEGITEV